jgi:hypothetical protein
MTMQTLVVLLIGIAFGWKLGVATIFFYLFEGIIGLPVFLELLKKDWYSLFYWSYNGIFNWIFICCFFCRKIFKLQ